MCFGSQVCGFLLCLCVCACVCFCCHLYCWGILDRWLAIKVSWCWSAAPFIQSCLLFIPCRIIFVQSRSLFSVLLYTICSSRFQPWWMLCGVTAGLLWNHLLLRNVAILCGLRAPLIAVRDLSLLRVVVPALLRKLSAPTILLSSFCCCRVCLQKINICALATEFRVFSWYTLTPWRNWQHTSIMEASFAHEITSHIVFKKSSCLNQRVYLQ